MRILLIVTLLAGLGYAFANTTLSPQPVLGPGAVIHMHEDMFKDLDAGNAEGVLSYLHKDMNMDDEYRRRPAQIFLMDMNGKVRRGMEYAQSRKLLIDWAAESKANGQTVKTIVRPLSSDCFSAELSYAVLEIDREYARGDVTWTERFHVTSLVTYEDGWKLTHMHFSPAEDTRVAARGKGDF